MSDDKKILNKQDIPSDIEPSTQADTHTPEDTEAVAESSAPIVADTPENGEAISKTSAEASASEEIDNPTDSAIQTSPDADPDSILGEQGEPVHADTAADTDTDTDAEAEAFAEAVSEALSKAGGNPLKIIKTLESLQHIAVPELFELAKASQESADQESLMEPPIPEVLPVLPVRDVVVFNYMILPLFIGREKSMNALTDAITGNRYIMVCTQRDEQVDEPGPDDIHEVGTVCMVMRMLKMPDGRIKTLVQGISRARIDTFNTDGDYLTATITTMSEAEDIELTIEHEAMIRTVREQSEKILALRGVPTAEIMSVLNNVDEPGRLADLIAANLRMKVVDAQAILQCEDPVARLKLITTQLTKEVELATIQARIQASARDGMEKAHKDYYLREQIKAIKHELGEGESMDDDIAALAEALDKAKLPKEARKEADKQLRRLKSMHPDSSESSVTRGYLEWLSELPWSTLSREKIDISQAKKILDDDHYGLDKIKDRILEYLSVRKLNPQSKGPILCFAGPPGVGKTSLGRSIARAIGRQFQRLSLGGMRDEAEIRGHRRTYVGAMPGRIINVMKQAGTRNPLIMLDEIDKLGSDFKGDPSSAMLEVLDPEQNVAFSDHYLNVDFDLSKVMFICTANNLDTIPAPLLDRMEIISLSGYTQQEKIIIAQKHLVPRQIAENGLKANNITFTEEGLIQLIRAYTREAGLRNLERKIEAVCRKIARLILEAPKKKRPTYTVDAALVHELLGAPRFLEEEKELVLHHGIALGLAWTAHGGEVLTIEVASMKGKGKLQLTGQLGDVMKESAQAAISYVRSRADEWNIDASFTENRDLHIHVPAGATPKDGPSAGVTLFTALISALTETPVNSTLCMTGEITLLGKVLPVGGIKEKILGAVALNLEHVIIPKQNIKDLEDIPEELLSRIEVHPVQHVTEVLPFAFPNGLRQVKRGKRKKNA